MVPAEPLILGLDVGTSRTKALLVDRLGRQVALSVEPTPFAATRGGVEMTVAQLDFTLSSVLDGLGELRRQVVAVGVAGIAESGAPLDRHGGALAPIIAWHDPRGHEVVARLIDRFGDELAMSIGQSVRTVSSVAKLGWLIDAGLSGVSRWLGVPELCLRRFTGVAATEYSLAARTGCYHVGERRYLPEVATMIGVAAGAFPPVAAAGGTMGRISAAGAAWSGLPAGIPVTIAGHDHLVGMVGSGGGAHDLVNSVGTAETLLGAVADMPDIHEARSRRVAITLMPGGDRWVGLASGARWALVLAQTARALGRSVDELDGLVGMRADGSAGEAPVVDTCPMLAAIEQGEPVVPPDGPPGAVWNGMHVVLARRAWDAADRLQAIVGPATRLVLVGRGSRSRPTLRAKAHLAGLPMSRSTATEAVARGAALYAGAAASWWPSAEAGPRATLEQIASPTNTPET